MKRFLLSILLLAGLTACEQDWNERNGYDIGNSGDNGSEESVVNKEKELWLDASANFKRFEKKEDICKWLDKIREVGFNKIVISVRSCSGDVIYPSKVMKQTSTLNGVTINRDWDYLEFMISEAHKRDMKAAVATTIFPVGSPSSQSGPVYRNEEWARNTCIQYHRSGMTDIRNEKNEVAAFANPLDTDVQKKVLEMLSELVTDYDLDALVLDYCRYPGGGASDFSDMSRQAFESYMGKSVEKWPEDIFTYNADNTRKPGPYYTQWWEFRSMNIRNFVVKVKECVKALKPEVQLEYWTGSWWHGLYLQGQNWASPNASLTPAPWMSNDYRRTGFADQLDIFQLGAYLKEVHGADNPSSVEYAINNAKKLIGSDCKLYGTLSCAEADFDIESAVYLCLMRTQGLMVFDIVHVINNNKWDAIRRGIERAEKDLKSQNASKQ